MKEFADDNVEFDENGVKFSKLVENTVGRGEIARYEQFLLFPQCFQKACTSDTEKSGLVLERVKLQFSARSLSPCLTNAKLYAGFSCFCIKGGYLDFSYLTELKNIYITKIYMKKQYKSSITKNHKITQKDFF